MTRMQSSITPDVPQMMQAAGQQGLARRQMNQQAAQAQQQAQLAQQQMQQQMQIAQGSQAVQLAGISEQARSQAEYRDLLDRRAETEAQLARDQMAQKQAQYNDEKAFRDRTVLRQEALEKARIMSEIKMAEASIEGRADMQAMLLQQQQEMADLAVRQQKAEALRTGKAAGFSDVMKKSVDQIETLLSNTELQVSEAKSQMESQFLDTNFVNNIATYGGAEAPIVSTLEGAAGVFNVTDIGKLFMDNPNFRDEARLAALGEDFYTGSLGGERGTSIYGTKQINPQDSMEAKAAQSVAMGIAAGDNAKQYRLAGALTEAMKKARTATGAEELMQIHQGLAQTATELGINKLTMDAALREIGNVLQARADAYTASGILSDGKYIERVWDNNDAVTVGDQEMRAIDAYIGGKFFNRNAIAGVRKLAGAGSDLKQMTTLRDRMMQEAGLSAEETLRYITKYGEEPGFGAGLFDPLEAAAQELLGAEKGITSLEEQRRLQDIQAGPRTNLALIRGEDRASRGQVAALQEILDAMEGL